MIAALPMNPGYKHFLESLSQHCRQAQTGVVHLYTAESQYGRLAIADGVITHIVLHTSRGMTALPALLNAAVRSHRFEPGAQLPVMDDLLETEDILAMLGCGELGPAAAPIAPSPAVPPPALAAAPAPRGGISGISAIELSLIEQELHQELGPMASSLVQECLAHSPTAQVLAERLADQLMPEGGARFLSRVRELLRARATQ